MWIVLRLKNMDPTCHHDGVPVRASSPSPGSAISDSDRAVIGSSDADVEDLTERTSVNMRSRFTTAKNGRGVLAKQFRRTLHNIAAIDMAAKPANHIDIHDSEVDNNQLYPAQKWLTENLETFKSYDLELPKWAEQTGELQLRCILKNGYAVLARIPWNYQQQKSSSSNKKNI